MRSILTILCLTALLDLSAAEYWPSTNISAESAAIGVITPNALAALGDSETIVVIDLAIDPLAVLTPLPADRDTYVVLNEDGFTSPIVWARARQIAALGYRRVLILWGWGC